MSRKRGVLRSASSAGVMPCFFAVCSILTPCSSVPVRKNTSHALQAPEARQRVRRDGLIGMADMGHVVRIGDGSGDVIGPRVCHGGDGIALAARPGKRRAHALNRMFPRRLLQAVNQSRARAGCDRD